MARSNATDPNKRQRDGGNWSGYQSQNQQSSGWGTFVNVYLTEEDTQNIKQFAPDAESMADLLDKLAQADYKVEVRWDTKYECYSAILKPVGDEHANGGLLLSGRGSTALKAIRQVAYKHFVVTQGVWGSWTERRNKNEIDD